MNKFDAIIIGMGPAGITASIYLKRFGHNVLVIGKDYGALEKADKIENYYALGTKSGKEIVMAGMLQASELGVLVNHDEVISIDYLDSGFLVKTKRMEYEAKTVLIATGKARNTFTKAKAFEGRGVSYCATCDGFFYRKKDISMVGYNEYMLHELEHLLPIVNSVTLYTNGNELEVEVPDTVKVIKEPIEKLYGENRLEGIKTASTDTKVAGCFVALGSANAFTIAKHLGLDLKDNNLAVDEKYMTNIPGIFAAGDVVGGVLQIVKAANDGCQAGYSMNKFIREN